MAVRAFLRHQQTEEFVRAFVTRDDYAIDESVELLLDPDKRGYPKTAEERDDLVRSLVHFQISNYLGAGEPLDEAKRRLVHRYELRSRRVAELEEVELYSSFMDSFAMSLDPHSNYLSSEVLEDFRITMSLSLEGIGVALSERDGFAVVERIIPGGAADQLDALKPEDKIIEVGQGVNEVLQVVVRRPEADVDGGVRDDQGLLADGRSLNLELGRDLLDLLDLRFQLLLALGDLLALHLDGL